MDIVMQDATVPHPPGGGGGARSEFRNDGIPYGRGVALGAAPFFHVCRHPANLQEQHHG